MYSFGALSEGIKLNVNLKHKVVFKTVYKFSKVYKYNRATSNCNLDRLMVQISSPLLLDFPTRYKLSIVLDIHFNKP